MCRVRVGAGQEEKGSTDGSESESDTDSSSDSSEDENPSESAFEKQLLEVIGNIQGRLSLLERRVAPSSQSAAPQTSRVSQAK